VHATSPLEEPGAGRGPEWWRRLSKPPESFLLDAGKEGELLIARIRVALTLVLVIIPLVNLVLAPDEREQHLAGLGVTLVALMLSIGVWVVVRRDRRHAWLPMATAVYDVTLVTVANLSFAYVTDPHVVVNSKVTFDIYFLAIGASALRFDVRVAVLAGVLAILQYAASVIIVWSSFPLDTVVPGGAYGVFRWADQVSRILLLVTATVLNIHIVRGIQRQRLLSSADPLTGVYNRRFFDDYVTAEAQRAARYGGTMAVAMIDVDHFKQFNDRFGHGAGDIALRHVARTLRLSVRRSDIVARYGGEEFIVLFREADVRQALDLVERIRQAVQMRPHWIGDARPVHVTVSAGVASWPEDGTALSDLLAAADRRLFVAKQAGRNRVIGPPQQQKAS
jgi:diguanylate cyclase (GGDEF)-like protein